MSNKMFFLGWNMNSFTSTINNDLDIKFLMVEDDMEAICQQRIREDFHTIKSHVFSCPIRTPRLFNGYMRGVEQICEGSS